ncbi:MAG TPA: nucleoside transporter C-terminal domain-containing protein [Caulifigura sp.]|nr:nucleoside transporter C-terminal domain-containing protein [Caulifigura sp.]
MQYQGLLGVAAVIAVCFVMSDNRRRIDWRLVIWGMSLQFAFAALVILSKPGQAAFVYADAAVNKLLSFSKQGLQMLLTPFGQPEIDPALINLGFFALPTVIFFSALLSGLYHLGIMQQVVRGMAWVMQRTMKTSGAETLSVTGDIFVGQTEAPLLIKPFIESMTRSELNTVMCGGFATIAGSVIGLYVSWLDGKVPNIAGHLMAASVMSAPAAILISKIIVPEVDTPVTSGTLNISSEKSAGNLIEAIGDGATDGMRLLLNIAAMLLAFVSIFAMLNAGLGWIGELLAGQGVSPSITSLFSLEAILGKIFQPLAWTLGVTWQEAETLGRLLGKKLVLTELVAYQEFGTYAPGEKFSVRSGIIASYALCGFANFASIGIQLGGTGAMAPSRKKDLASLAMRAMIGGALTTCMTAAVAGLFIKV